MRQFFTAELERDIEALGGQLSLDVQSLLNFAPLQFTPRLFAPLVFPYQSEKLVFNEDGDFAGDESTTGLITVNGDSVTGRIDSASDIDWIRIDNPDQFSILTLDFTTDAQLGVVIDLMHLDMGNNEVRFESQITAESSGEINFSLDPGNVGNELSVYFLALSPRDNPAHNYTLTVSNDTSGVDEYAEDATTTGVLTLDGTVVEGRMNSGADKDWFRIDNPDNFEFLLMTYESADASLMEFTLIGIDADGTGSEVYRDVLTTDIAGELEFTLPDATPDTVFFIQVAGIEGFTFDYTLSMDVIGGGVDDFAGDSSTDGFLKPGTVTTTGVIEANGDSDWFSFTAAEGQVLDFAILRQGSTDLCLEVSFVIRDANGDIVPMFDYLPSELYNQATFIAPEAGTYYLDVSSSNGWNTTSAQVIENYGAYEIFPILSGLPSSLAPAFQVGYTPWSELPDTGLRPTVNAWQGGAYFVEEDFTVAAHETFFWGLESNDAAVTGMSLTGTDAEFVNQGRIYVEDLYGFIENDNFPIASGSWAYAVAGGNASLFRNEGEVVAISSFFNAAGFVDVTGFTTFENLGQIKAVSAYGNAFGADSLDDFANHFNSGTIEAWGGNSATGFTLLNGGFFDNSGLIEATGQVSSVGIYLDGFSSSITNSGTILAQTLNGAEVGIFAFADNGAGGSNTFQIDIVNSGLIDAQTAILIFQDTDPTVQGSEEYVNIDNQADGIIRGDILLDMGADRMTNRGEVEGNIFMGAGNDIYSGSLGTIEGFIHLGDGDDRGIGGAGNEIFIGGLGNDVLTGGAGADKFVFAAGDGRDTITDFNAAEDILELGLSPYMLISDFWDMLSQHDGYVMLDMGSGSTVRLNGVELSELSIDNFIFDDGSGDGPGPFIDPGRSYADIKQEEWDAANAAQAEKDEASLVAEVLDDDFEVAADNALATVMETVDSRDLSRASLGERIELFYEDYWDDVSGILF